MINSGFILTLDRFGSSTSAVYTVTRRGKWSHVRGESFEITVHHGKNKRQDATTVALAPNLVLACSGHIDNPEEVGRWLGDPMVAARPDAEICAAAYAAWGCEFGKYVIGQFACAAVDLTRGRTVCVRDSLGIGRLFRHSTGKVERIASDLGMLLACIPDQVSIDKEGLTEFVKLSGPGAERTIFSGIFQVPPSHALVMGPGAPMLCRYWHPDFEHSLRSRSPAEMEELLRVTLRRAVNASMRGGERICSELSGGLDSSTVTSVAADLCQHPGALAPLIAYSFISSTTSAADESCYQNAVAGALGIEHYKIDAATHPHFGPYEGEVPCEPTLALLVPLISRGVALFAERREIDVCLTGEGGDAVFYGGGLPPWHLMEWLCSGRLRSWTRDATAFVRSRRYSIAAILRLSVGELALNAQSSSPTWLTSGACQAYDAAPILDFSRIDGSRHSARRRQFAVMRRIACWVRPKVQWSERHPLLHRDVIDLMLAVPWDQKLSPLSDRVLQRRALSGILPEPVRRRTDKAQAEAAFLQGLRINWGQLQSLIKAPHLAEHGIVDSREFEVACSLMRHGVIQARNSFTSQLAALAVERWLALGGLNVQRRMRSEFQEMTDFQGSEDRSLSLSGELRIGPRG